MRAMILYCLCCFVNIGNITEYFIFLYYAVTSFSLCPIVDNISIVVNVRVLVFIDLMRDRVFDFHNILLQKTYRRAKIRSVILVCCF